MTSDDKEKRDAIMRSVMKIKNQHYQMYQMRGQPSKLCQWCNTKITGSGGFCSEECDQKHQKAVEEYEFRKAERERVQRAK